MNLIDTNCSLGVWPYSGEGYRSLEELRDLHMRVHGVDFSLLASVDSLFREDNMPANRYLLDLCADQTDVLALPTINPRYANVLGQARELASHPACAGIRLVPSFHHYRLYDENVIMMCEFLQSEFPHLPVVIVIRVDDHRMRPEWLKLYPLDVLDVFALTQRFPKLNFLLLGGLREEAIRILGNHEDRSPPSNLYSDISFIDGIEIFTDLIIQNGLSSECLMFGTGEPFLSGMAGCLSLETLDREEAYKVGLSNILSIFPKIKLTASSE